MALSSRVLRLAAWSLQQLACACPAPRFEVPAAPCVCVHEGTDFMVARTHLFGPLLLMKRALDHLQLQVQHSMFLGARQCYSTRTVRQGNPLDSTKYLKYRHRGIAGVLLRFQCDGATSSLGATTDQSRADQQKLQMVLDESRCGSSGVAQRRGTHDVSAPAKRKVEFQPK